MNKEDLSALVSSRICHDLISPIGAISNGVELMQDLTNKPSPELGLIGESVNSASAKLRYFRIAFGATPKESKLQMSEVRLATGAMFQGRTVVVLDTAATELPRIVGKLLLLTLLCVEKSLPLGGEIRVALSAMGFSIAVECERVKPMEAFWDMVDGGIVVEDLAASDVQFILLGTTVALQRAKFQRKITDGAIRISLAL
ncbi:histidine phosphotransferase family protein [Algicella marina]|uniref:Histidine phosphotransferase n=1 Tax=Algicella marina TaxID=2683284 RepID=A0A6P1SXC3_9RHOB|nr:histidine phosphotransferase family protein [Algicella marina]QHQ35324.1 histidine phosphotransferase [Algicella marina]